MASSVIVIPSRLASTRLANKPLLDVDGVPMVVKVAQNSAGVSGVDRVVVATPDLEIKDLVASYGFEVFSSNKSCRSGTDRLVEFSNVYKFDYYINVQGDEPLMSSEVIKSYVDKVIDSQYSAAIGVIPVDDSKDIFDLNVVKVALSREKLIYASRSPIPFMKKPENQNYFRHAGIYSFKKSDLEIFGSIKPGPLEELENIEILRLLELNVPVNFVKLKNFGPSVDTQSDLDRVRELLTNAN